MTYLNKWRGTASRSLLLIGAIALNLTLLTSSARASDDDRACKKILGAGICYCGAGSQGDCVAHNADSCYANYPKDCQEENET